MVQLDPTRIQVQSNANPSWEQEETFQDLMAERLRQAPWLILSFALHAVLLLLIWALFPPEEPKKAKVAAGVTPGAASHGPYSARGTPATPASPHHHRHGLGLEWEWRWRGP